MASANPATSYFGDLAHEYSIEPVSRANYGEVPPIQRHGGQPLLEDKAFDLEPGEMSGLISVGDKYVILKCLGRTKPIVTQRADVEEELTRDIYEKKMRIAMADEFDRLKTSATIDNYLAGTLQTGKRDRVRTASHAAPATR
jgi:parvulin-like peptidyl-prolyl isomerase